MISSLNKCKEKDEIKSNDKNSNKMISLVNYKTVVSDGCT